MAKIQVLGDAICYFCPGCKVKHCISVGRWKWNEDVNKPTITPSVLVNHNTGYMECHHWITDGFIDFKNDVTPSHELAGKIVELPEIEPI